ncbi:cytochrome P450 85A1-like [Andrographis paniculata]|uniref:cytochrome P450 85A1-like n=1 Tax=Andrographis paniculata TaxID=175694 RepID=UPI0021E7B3C2|nr:cytochrome P450 85A1-like [Andrographis paniculata]
MVETFWVWVVLGFGVLWVCLVKWNQTKYCSRRRKGRRLPLPPGTMGWPLFGETKDFIQKGPQFMIAQRQRYGSVFKTHILGSPAIISMDPDLNRYILKNESKGIVPGYPKSMVDILGQNISTVSGDAHRIISKNLLSLVGAPAIKDNIFHNVVAHTFDFISSWDGITLDFQEKALEFAFMVMFKQIMGADSNSIYDEFKAEFDKLQTGTLSLPINIPGSNYRTGMMAKKKVKKILAEMLEKRRGEMKEKEARDMLEILVRNEEQKYSLSDDDEIIEQIVTILYSGYETVSKTLMMCVKYLHDHPQILQEFKEEHFGIKKKRGGKLGLDWEDYKAMRFTRAVIMEASRLSTIVNGVMRKTTNDVELNGFVVPKGWRIYVYTRELNYDPHLYPNPLQFNPSRWLDRKCKLEANPYFLLFGGGGRVCPGKDLGIVLISLFLHLFVTTYRWEEDGKQKLEVFPRVMAPNGYNIKLTKLELSS